VLLVQLQMRFDQAVAEDDVVRISHRLWCLLATQAAIGFDAIHFTEDDLSGAQVVFIGRQSEKSR
jgi:hypothetical protein